MPHSSGLEFSSSRRFRLEGSRVGGRGGVYVEWVVRGWEGLGGGGGGGGGRETNTGGENSLQGATGVKKKCNFALRM